MVNKRLVNLDWARATDALRNDRAGHAANQTERTQG